MTPPPCLRAPFLARCLLGLGLVLFCASGTYAGVHKADYDLGFGVVYPSFAKSARLNPSALAFEKTIWIGTFYASSLNSGASNSNYGIDSSFAADQWGLGINLEKEDGLIGSNDDLSIGAAIKGGSFSFGLGLSSDVFDGNSFTPSYTVALSSRVGEEANFAVVFNNLSSTPQATMGLGYSNKGYYALELDLTLPAFDALSSTGSAYTLSASVAAHSELVDLAFQASRSFYVNQDDGYFGLNYQFAAMFWLGNSYNLSLRVPSTQFLEIGIAGSF